MASTKILHALFEDDDDVLHAVGDLKSEGIKITEVFTPFPIHGLDKKLGVPHTRLAIASFLYGVFGLALACFLTWYTMIHDWPQDIGGKPSFTWYENVPAFVPIMFELTVFCAAHLMVITFLLRSELWPGHKPQNPDPRTTDDKFLMELIPGDNEAKAIELLKKNNVLEISEIDGAH